MTRHARIITSGLVLGLALWLMGAGDTQSADADPQPKAQTDKQAKAPDAKAAADVAKKNEMGEVMHLFKLRTKGGVGAGPAAGAITPDGIEAKIMGLGKKPLSPADLKAQGDA